MIDYRIITRDWLEEMNARGLPVYAWTMDSRTSWRRYTGRIDAVITNITPGGTSRSATGSSPAFAPTRRGPGLRSRRLDGQRRDRNRSRSTTTRVTSP